MGAERVTFTQRDQGGPPTSSEEVRVEKPLEESVGVSRGKTWKRHPKLRDNVCERAAIQRTHLSRNHTPYEMLKIQAVHAIFWGQVERMSGER